MITRLILVILLGIPLGAQGQEWWDLKYHEGNDAARYNNDPNFQGNLHRDPTLRAKEKGQSEGKVNTKAIRKRKVVLDREKADAFALINVELTTNGGKLLNCDRCEGHGILMCTACDGEGSTVCSSCHGISRTDCRSCSGTGVVNEQPCTACDGSGKKKCQFCGGLNPTCKQCLGLGYSNCEECLGTAKMILSSDGTATWKVSQHMESSSASESTAIKKTKKH
jgi:hypothetical protein